MTGRRVLILGGTGFIGVPLAARLRSRGDDVATLSRSATADVRLDALDPLAVRDFLVARQFDAVVNLMGAGLATATVDADTLAAINARVPRLVLEALLDSHPRTQFVHAASSTERTAPDEPDESDYSRTKHEGAEALRALAMNAQEPVSLLRIHNTYGPGQPPTRFIAGTVAALSDGREIRLNYPDRVRDFVYLDDVVDSFLQVLDDAQPGLWDAELGTGIGTSLLAAARAAARVLGRPESLVQRIEPPLNDPHPRAVADTPGGTLGTCVTSLTEGLRRMTGGR